MGDYKNMFGKTRCKVWSKFLNNKIYYIILFNVNSYGYQLKYHWGTLHTIFLVFIAGQVLNKSWSSVIEHFHSVLFLLLMINLSGFTFCSLPKIDKSQQLNCGKVKIVLKLWTILKKMILLHKISNFCDWFFK